MKKISVLLAALILALSVLFSGCEKKNALPEPTPDISMHRYEGSFIDVFDTVTKIVLYAPDEDTASALVDEVHALLREYHTLFDIYNAYDGVNNIKTVNDNAGVAPVKVDQKLIDLVSYAKEMYTLTSGKMNIAFGSVLHIWHNYREAGIDDPKNAALPPMDDLTAAAAHCNIDDVIVDADAATIYLADPAMSLDVGAIAKGYAAQKVVDTLIGRGVTDLLLSVGGNVCGIGSRIDGTPWKVGIQNPDLSSSEYLCYLAVRDTNLVTSGSYQRYYTVGDTTYHHIIDPVTLMPATYFISVSVLAPDSGLADALSTALFNMPLSEGQAFVASLDNVEAMWVFPDGTQVQSDGFAAYIIENP